MASSSVTIISKSTIRPDQPSTITSLKLSVSDLPLLSYQYIQKGVLLPSPPTSTALLPLLKHALSRTLSCFPALAGRLHTFPSGHIHILCNDHGVDFVHAQAPHLSTSTLLPSPDHDIPSAFFRQFFQFNDTISYAGHDKPLIAVQVTELKDAVFIGCSANHGVVDGTSFWNFFNVFAEVARGEKMISKVPNFNRETVFDSQAVLDFPPGGPSVAFDVDAPLREKIFHFSRESILKLKFKANNPPQESILKNNGSKVREISSFQSLCAHLWISMTRARKLEDHKITTFKTGVNCRHRLEPCLDMLYFGNAIQSIPTVATAGELLAKGLSWGAYLLHRSVVAHDDATVRRGIRDWESNPRSNVVGNFDGATVLLGSSPRFPMYDNDFGWGRPLAVRSGKAHKFDGKISAFPSVKGDGSVDFEVALEPTTMASLESDLEFMQYVSQG